MNTITDEELLAYADELLDINLSVQIEKLLRDDEIVRERFRTLLAERDQGSLSIGEIWRHERLSCPQRSELGLYLIDALEAVYSTYITFHLEQVGCSYCLAILEEMRDSLIHDQNQEASKKRKEKVFASSAGLLRESD